MEFEDILLDVGDYGKYQRNLIMIFLVPTASLLPWFTMNVLFMVSVPDHWCKVPELVSSNLSLSQQRSLISPPGEHCLRYDLNYTNVDDLLNYTISENFTKRPCDRGWEFDHTYYDSTVATKWNVVCDDEHYKSFVLTMYNVGSIVGTPIYGLLSDKIGRKITFFITIIVTAVTAISSVLMTNFTAFVVLKTLNGSLMPSIFQLPYIIILEIVAPEMRTRMNGIVNLSWTFGLCFLPLLAYYSRSWVTLGLITSSVTLIFLLYYTFLPESPRWLVSQERYDEAAVIMHHIGKKNGKIQEKSVLVQKLQKLGEKMKKEKTEDGVKNSAMDILRYPQLRKKFIIITICWMADIMAYYGLQLNVSNLAGNEFVNFFLTSIVEIPGYLTSWVVMERYGRRWCSAIGFLLTGIVCMLPALVSDYPYGDLICSVIGKYFAALTFMATYQQSSELFPTVVRSIGMGMSSTISMMVTLVVPYLVFLSVYGKAIPFVIIGAFGILAGFLAAFLPETLNENLPQTIFDAEEFGKKQKFFAWNRRRLSVGRERASSIIAFKQKMDIFSINDDNQTKSQRSSQILQNVEFSAPSEHSSSIATEMVRYRNSRSESRDSTGSHNRDNYIIQNVPLAERGNSLAEDSRQRSDSKRSNQAESEQNIDDKIDNMPRRTSARSAADDRKASLNTAPIQSDDRKPDEKYSYVNTMFDNNNDVAVTMKRDGVSDVQNDTISQNENYPEM